MTKHRPDDLSLRRMHNQILALLGGGAILSGLRSVEQGRIAGLDFSEIEQAIINGRVVTARKIENGTVAEGACTVCTLRGKTDAGRAVGLLIEVQEAEGFITGIDVK